MSNDGKITESLLEQNLFQIFYEFHNLKKDIKKTDNENRRNVVIRLVTIIEQFCRKIFEEQSKNNPSNDAVTTHSFQNLEQIKSYLKPHIPDAFPLINSSELKKLFDTRHDYVHTILVSKYNLEKGYEIVDEFLKNILSKSVLGSAYYDLMFGAYLNKIGQYIMAEEHFSNMLDKNMFSVEVYLNMANSIYNQGHHAKSEKWYKDAMKIDDKYAKTHHVLGLRYYHHGSFDMALKHYNSAIKIDPNYVGVYIDKGKILMNYGQYDESIKCYNSSIKINKNNAKAYYFKSIALSLKNDIKNTIKCYNEAKNKNLFYADEYVDVGYIFYLYIMFDKSKECYDEAIRIDPDFFYAHYRIALLFETQRKYKDAMKYYNKTIELNPNFSQALNSKGNLLLQQGKYEEALKYHIEALDKKSDMVESYNFKGVALLKLHKYYDAEICFKRALNKNPKYLKIIYNLIHALESQNKTTESQKYKTNIALLLHPRSPFF